MVRFLCVGRGMSDSWESLVAKLDLEHDIMVLSVPIRCSAKEEENESTNCPARSQIPA